MVKKYRRKQQRPALQEVTPAIAARHAIAQNTEDVLSGSRDLVLRLTATLNCWLGSDSRSRSAVLLRHGRQQWCDCVNCARATTAPKSLLLKQRRAAALLRGNLSKFNADSGTFHWQRIVLYITFVVVSSLQPKKTTCKNDELFRP